ncbi:hypothetical protein V6N11_077755 [Hibiscus sabdariffa]|uniref:Uncharacterized protein n=1 Tax=Hibiscus sabdariffa TaxID=183260 RepID=A0ABR2TEW0_9ROSI
MWMDMDMAIWDNIVRHSPLVLPNVSHSARLPFLLLLGIGVSLLRNLRSFGCEKVAVIIIIALEKQQELEEEEGHHHQKNKKRIHIHTTAAARVLEEEGQRETSFGL